MHQTMAKQEIEYALYPIIDPAETVKINFLPQT